MTGTFGDVVLTLSASVELSIVFKATVALAVGLLIAWTASRARASRRYLVLAATFGVLLLLPFAALVAPPVTIVVRSAPVADVVVETAGADTDAPGPVPTTPVNVPAVKEPAHRQPAWTMPSVASVLGTVWMIGIAFSLLPVGIMLWRLRALRRSAVAWTEGEALVRRLSIVARVRRAVTVLRHQRVAAPMTSGLFAPVILLPGDAPGWSNADLERALVHELEHVRRMDWPAHLLARTVCALYWFHPLVWRAWRLLHLEADRACDDAVVVRGEGRAFAEQLVTLAQRISSETPRPILAMAGRGDLSRRVRAALDPKQVRGRAGALSAATVTIGTLTVVAVISPLRAVESSKPAVTAGDRRLAIETFRVHPSQPAAVVRAPRRVARRQTEAVVAAGRFETVSIRRSTFGAEPGSDQARLNRNGVIPSPAGTAFIADEVTIEGLIAWAYGIAQGFPSNQSGVARPFTTIEGLPVWTDRFDIRAKAPFPVSDPPEGTLGAMHLMVQQLLAERFNLATHWEPRLRSVYVLTQAPGSSGLGLRAATGPCGNLPGLDLPPCGTTSSEGVLDGTRHIRVGHSSLKGLANTLERDLGDRVVDRTGILGVFNTELRYTRSSPWAPASPASSGRPARPPLAEVAASPDWPLLADALRDQLGIQLTVESADGEMLVIDRVERPMLD